MASPSPASSLLATGILPNAAYAVAVREFPDLHLDVATVAWACPDVIKSWYTNKIPVACATAIMEKTDNPSLIDYIITECHEHRARPLHAAAARFAFARSTQLALAELPIPPAAAELFITSKRIDADVALLLTRRADTRVAIDFIGSIRGRLASDDAVITVLTRLAPAFGQYFTGKLASCAYKRPAVLAYLVSSTPSMLAATCAARPTASVRSHIAVRIEELTKFPEALADIVDNPEAEPELRATAFAKLSEHSDFIYEHRVPRPQALDHVDDLETLTDASILDRLLTRAPHPAWESPSRGPQWLALAENPALDEYQTALLVKHLASMNHSLTALSGSQHVVRLLESYPALQEALASTFKHSKAQMRLANSRAASYLPPPSATELVVTPGSRRKATAAGYDAVQAASLPVHETSMSSSAWGNRPVTAARYLTQRFDGNEAAWSTCFALAPSFKGRVDKLADVVLASLAD